jgi:hypothetical protein
MYHNKFKTERKGRMLYHTLIKKKIKFSSYIRKFSCKVIYEEGLPNI